jgi:predicted RNA methylase
LHYLARFLYPDAARRSTFHSMNKDIRPEPSASEIADGYLQFVGDEVALWHFPMMNDVVRNAGYENALKAAIHDQSIVLEIGTGSGLLSMMAARLGAAKVITCEAIPMIAAKAVAIIKRNGFADRIKVLSRSSNGLKISAEYPALADILVTEIFDDGLLGEGAFGAIDYAREHLLKPGAQLIPCGARVMAMCIESREIFENYRVEGVSGFDLSGFNEFSVRGYVGCHLDKFKYRALSSPKELFVFDFNKITRKGVMPCEFEISDSGVSHAIAYWFELQLDEKTKISTGPGLSRLSCWKQAVQLAETPRPITKGDRLKLTAHHDSDGIWFTN